MPMPLYVVCGSRSCWMSGKPCQRFLVRSNVLLIPTVDRVGTFCQVQFALISMPRPGLEQVGWCGWRWLEGYVDQLLTRDVLTVDDRRDPVRLRRYFEAYALSTTGSADHKTIYDAARINYKTARAYDQLLQNLMVVDHLPAWTSNRLKRLTRAPKRYLVDPSLLGGALGVDTNAVLRDGDLLGRLLDTFVTAQLRAEATVVDTRPRLCHARQEQGRHEIDVVVELGGRRIIAIEIKASSAPSISDARHLQWFRDQLADRFIGGVVLHTGPNSYPLDDGQLPRQ